MKAFRRACFGAARLTGGEVTEFRFSTEPTPNFRQGILTYRDRTVAVAGVRGTLLLAVAVPRVIEFAPTRESGPLTFVDFPQLASALAAEPGVRVLSTTELAGPPNWLGLSRSDLRYSQSGCLGEALFNYWD